MPKKSRARINLASIAIRLSEQTELWRPLVRYDPISRFYARLANQPDFEAWLLTWAPGQGTDWHDHDGSAGAFVTVQGTLSERTADISGDGLPRIVSETHLLQPASLRTFGTRHLHRVTNNGLEAAVSIHVYAPALTEMNRFDEHGPVLEHVDSQLAGRNR